MSERDIERLSQQHSCKKQAQKSVLAFSHVTKQAYDPLHKGATLEVLTRTGSPVYTRARGRPLHAQCEGRQMPKCAQVVQDRTRVIVCPGCACVRSCTRGAGAGRTTGSLLLRPRLRVDRPSTQRISTEASPRDSMRTRCLPATLSLRQRSATTSFKRDVGMSQSSHRFFYHKKQPPKLTGP